jgi:hypothetical protein
MAYSIFQWPGTPTAGRLSFNIGPFRRPGNSPQIENIREETDLSPVIRIEHWKS